MFSTELTRCAVGIPGNNPAIDKAARCKGTALRRFDMTMSDGADGTIKNCVQERDGIAWPPGCVTDAGLEYCKYDGIRRTVALKEQNPNLKVRNRGMSFILCKSARLHVLCGVNLPGYILCGVNLPGYLLCGVNLPGYVLCGVNLPGYVLCVNLPGYVLCGVNLPGYFM